MGEYKSLKDPIYGYIKIDNKILSNIVDTACFQRLRNVIQTSYSPVYSSAVHNRFVHSLGVYHLGKIVTETLRSADTKCEGLADVDRWFELFELACLLHDVGHAPFSHTGEEFYLDKGERIGLHKTIVELTEDAVLEKEIESKDYKAAPHELMSIIVSLRTYPELFSNSAEKSFFARCISGYQYTETAQDKKLSFLNCLISFLNSDVIDVDKLDYLIRDAYITGFDTISIDYERLLRNVKIREDEADNRYRVAYKKGAISVIENVVYARDAERKWIQNHPVVRYEGYLQQRAIEAVLKKYGANLFSYEYLTEEGKDISAGWRVALLCDADILFLMKNTEDEAIQEYFSRKDRRHPVWKSESEYRANFDDSLSDAAFATFENLLAELGKYLNYLGRSGVVDSNALEACEKDIAEMEPLVKESENLHLKAMLANKHRILAWMQELKTFAESQGVAFDFVILQTKQFSSGFSNEAFSKIQIEFPGLNTTCDFKNVTNVLKVEESKRDAFFFLYYRKPLPDKVIDWGTLIDNLIMLATKESRKRR